MKNLYRTLGAGILISAFFTFGTAFAVENENRVPQHVCAKETQETILTKAIEESPELLMDKIEGDRLNFFFQKMRDKAMLVGSIGVDKVYVFLSEHHPEWVYVFFLNQGCILDVKFTFKKLIEEFANG